MTHDPNGNGILRMTPPPGVMDATLPHLVETLLELAGTAPVRLELDIAGVAIRLHIVARTAPSSPASPARRLSPTEQEVVDVLADGGWRVSARIAEAVGVQPSSQFSALLTNLAEAGVLESSQRHGFRLAPGQAVEEE